MMKKLCVIIPFLILLAIAVHAKCGDNLCDPNEDCESCPDDCLCTYGAHYEKIECCNDFSCKECEKGYCHDRKCNGLEGFTDIFTKVECFENGSVKLEINFLIESSSLLLTPGTDLKVYMKPKDAEETFTEISGLWINPSREDEFKYTKIRDKSQFISDKDLFKDKREYYVRVKYKMGRSDSIFSDTVTKCPGMPKEEDIITPPVTEEAEEEPELLEPKEEIKPEEPIQEPITESKMKKDKIILYAIGSAVLCILIFFVVRYEIKIKKRE